MSELYTSCLLSMGQLLKGSWMRSVTSIRGGGCSHLVVVSGTEINHDMFVPVSGFRASFQRKRSGEYAPIEKHDCAWIIQLVHLPIDAP